MRGFRGKGLRWTASKLGKLYGTGWNMQSNRDVPFVVDLSTGEHTGGGVTAASSPVAL